MEHTYRFGRLVIDFPRTANYPVEVRVDGQLVSAEYRHALGSVRVGETVLSDAEIAWLEGFDGEVTDHEAQWDAAVNP